MDETSPSSGKTDLNGAVQRRIYGREATLRSSILGWGLHQLQGSYPGGVHVFRRDSISVKLRASPLFGAPRLFARAWELLTPRRSGDGGEKRRATKAAKVGGRAGRDSLCCTAPHSLLINAYIRSYQRTYQRAFQWYRNSTLLYFGSYLYPCSP